MDEGEGVEMKRIETGALQIDDDWTGLFIRGDDALYLRDILSMTYANGTSFDKEYIYKLIRIIDVDVDHNHTNKDVQRIRRRDDKSTAL